jgi:hypothetical protein
LLLVEKGLDVVIIVSLHLLVSTIGPAEVCHD